MDKVKKHFDIIAKTYDSHYKVKHKFYYKNLKKLLAYMIPKNKIVFEVGCGTGDLLNYVVPKKGFGMDISGEMIKKAKLKYKNHANLTFSTNYPKGKYSYIFMSDVIEHLKNPIAEFIKISKLMNKNSQLIITMANPIWEPVLMLGEKVGYKMPEGPHNRIKNEEIKRLFKKVGLKMIKHDHFLLMPIYVPFITNFVNTYLERYLKKYAFIEYIVAKKG